MCKNHTKTKGIELDRRRLLKALGAGAALPGFHPVTSLLSGLIAGASLEARAQAGKEPRRFVFIYLEAGPSRWAFDLALNPHAGNAIVRNGGVNNAFDGAGQPTYLSVPLTVAGQTLNMPAMWAGTLPRPGGTPEPMSKLMENMLIIRGYDMQADGHLNNRLRQIYPLTGAPSLPGLVADKTSAPLPSVSLVGPFMDDAYFSSQGVGQLVWNAGDATRNPLQQFLDPFVIEEATKVNPLFQSRKDVDDLVEKALSKMQAATERRMPGAKGMFKDRANARQLFNRELGNLNDSYTALFTKYRALISASMALDIPNVTAAVVPGAALAPGHRLAILPTVAGGFPLENGDLRSILKADTTIVNLAEGFAVAEYLLTQSYGAAVGINANLPVNMAFVANGALVNAPYITDEHANGTATSTIALAFYYRSVAACTYELINVLKTAGMWDDTVIQIASEFSRSARGDGTGSDHGYEANVTSIYSGAIKKPAILGNIRINNSPAYAATAMYDGTWGAAAPVNHDSTIGHLNIGHVTSTVASLLRVDRPMKNFLGIVEVEDSGIVPVIGEATNV